MKNKYFVFTLYLMSLMKEFILKFIFGSRQSNRIDQLSAGREGTVVRNTAMSKFQEIWHFEKKRDLCIVHYQNFKTAARRL